MPLFAAAMRSLLKKLIDTTGTAPNAVTTSTAAAHRDRSGAVTASASRILSHAHQHRHSKQPHAAAASTAVGGDMPVTARMKAKFSEADLRLAALEEGPRRRGASAKV
jgi:hypothetical protein